MTTKKLRFELTIGTLFIASSLLLGVGTAFDQLGLSGRKHVDAQSQPAGFIPDSAIPTQTPKERIQGEPTQIRIPSVDVDLKVEPGYYDAASRSWTLTNNAHFAAMSTQPNNIGGTTFVYGHNKRGVFAGLTDIKPGATAYISTASGKTFVYRYSAQNTVSPDDVWVLQNTARPTLLLQTCTGAWFQNRTLYTFEFVEVK
jgi:LPXTG-site transpeptidase (sortase) family protein